MQLLLLCFWMFVSREETCAFSDRVDSAFSVHDPIRSRGAVTPTQSYLQSVITAHVQWRSSASSLCAKMGMCYLTGAFPKIIVL